MEKSWRKGRRVAIVGGGPGGISAAIAFRTAGYDVKVFERSAKPRPLGGAVMISTPVMEILRSYDIDIVNNFASQTVTNFANHKGKPRVSLPFVKELELASGIPGWHYGILRSTTCDKMMEVLNAKAPDTIVGNHALESYEETETGVTLHFTEAKSVEADLLVGADGIRSVVSKQAFGEPDLFHVGLRVWLAWCEDVPGVDRDNGWIHHLRNVQASYFPMKHEGKPGFEWWIVERSGPNATQPTDVEAHMRNLPRPLSTLRDFAFDHTGILQKFVEKDYRATVSRILRALPELHVG